MKGSVAGYSWIRILDRKDIAPRAAKGDLSLRKCSLANRCDCFRGRVKEAHGMKSIREILVSIEILKWCVGEILVKPTIDTNQERRE